MRTFNDQLLQLTDSLTIESKAERLYRLARAAVRSCYQDIGTRHPWRYLIRDTQINLLAPYSDGTVQYTAATRTLVLTGGTWPSWALAGEILLNHNVYTVSSVVNSTTLILTPDRSPVVDLAAGTSYVLAQTRYNLPVDFVEAIGITELERVWPVSYLSPEDMLARRQFWFQPATILFYTILGGQNGIMQIQWTPPPSDARTFDVLYQAKPRPFALSGQFTAGTVSTTSGSNTVTLANGVLPLNVVGAVFRLGTQTNAPEGPVGKYPAIEEHVIASRVSDTQFTTQDNLGTSGSAQLHTIDDPIDLEPTAMMTYFDRMCEARTLQMHMAKVDRVAKAQVDETKAFVKAIEADSRLTPKCVTTNPFAASLYAMMFGVTPHGAV